MTSLAPALHNHRARARDEAPPAPEAPAPTPDDVVLLREIRDLLKK